MNIIDKDVIMLLMNMIQRNINDQVIDGEPAMSPPDVLNDTVKILSRINAVRKISEDWLRLYSSWDNGDIFIEFVYVDGRKPPGPGSLQIEVCDSGAGILYYPYTLRSDMQGKNAIGYKQYDNVDCICDDILNHMIQGDVDYLSENIDDFYIMSTLRGK